MGIGESPGQPLEEASAPLNHPDFWTVLLTVPEVAERLGLSRAKTFTLISDGSIVSRKIGSARRVLLGDLARYIAGLDGGQGEAVTQSAHTENDHQGEGVA